MLFACQTTRMCKLRGFRGQIFADIKRNSRGFSNGGTNLRGFSGQRYADVPVPNKRGKFA